MNVTLIGMPGCGKSTIGVILAKDMGYHFIDVDLVIQEEEGCLLRDIIAREGIDGFCRVENRVNAALTAERSIIAPGGSVIYGQEAMEHLRALGPVVYIRLSCEEVESRLGDLAKRGVAVREGQTFRDLYRERCPLYEKYADMTVDADGLSLGDTMRRIEEALQKYSG